VIRLEVAFRAIFWLCFVGLTGLALSPAPYLPPLDIFNWWDKAQHAIGFGSLTVSALMAYPQAPKWKVAVLLCVHGCLIEVLQYFSGYRFGDWQDAAADGVGVAIGLALYVILIRFNFMNAFNRQDRALK
jgi:VanZ family protein